MTTAYHATILLGSQCSTGYL